MANYNMDNVSLFHSFSKVAAADNTALAAAVNKAGHVVTASDVWANEIPFCGSADSLADIKTKFADNTAFPVGTLGYDLGSSKLYQKGTENWTEITPAAVGSYVTISYKDKPVLRWYNKAHLTLLTPENNGAPSNGFSAKYLGPAADGVGAISQFVSSTDKIVNGIVSDGYDVAVFDGTKKLTKGTSTAAADNQWMDSAYAGMILFMCAQTSKNLSMTCFEYVGDKLETSLSDIRQSIKNISDVTLKGVVASVTADENTAQKAGITVDNTVSTTPVIKFTAGSVATGETKLVSGGAVAAVTDALAGRIAALEGVKLSVKVVDAVPTTPVVNTLYLVPEEGSTTGTYVEYIAYKPEGSETVTTERIGTTAVDLSGYTTDDEHTALANRVTALDADTTGRVAVVESEISTLKTTTIPAIQKSVTDLTKTVGDNKTAIEKALADAKTEIGKTTSGLDTRLQTAEGKVSTLEGQVATITSSDATKEGSIAKALADAKTYAEGKASAAEAAAKSEASTNLSAAVEEIAKDIEAAKQAAIANAKVTLTADTAEGKTGIVIDPNATQSTSFTIGIDQSVIATKTFVDEVRVLVTGVSQTVTDIQAELSDGSVATGISEAKAAAQTAQEAADAAQATANQAKTTADSAVQSVTRASSSSTLLTVTDGTDVTISLSTEVATKSDVADAKKAGTDAASALNTAKGQSLAQTGTLSGMFSVATAGTVGTGITSITVTDAGLANAIADAKKAGTDAASALNTAKNQSLAQTGTLSDMFTVQTAGTVGTGITSIIISDAGLSAAITKAKTDAEATAAANLATARGEITTEIATEVSKITTGAGSLGAKVEALETATGTTLPAAIEQALTDAKAYSDSLHTTSLDYVVLGDSEPLPTASAETLGKIYLVASQNAPAGDGAAISGSYVEYMTRKVSETEYTWEKIGTTAADLNAYAKTADVTSSIATAKSEAIAAAKTETTTQVSALAATHATDKAAIEGSIGTINNTIAAMDANLSVNGISVKQVDGKVTELSEALITASVPVGTTKVEGNIAYVGSTKHVIAPEKFETAAQMPATLTSWVADLSNLTVGDNMFKGCAGLTVFVGDLSSLTSGVDMFNGCTLDKDSLEILSETLPTVSGGTIDIGASTNATADMIAEIKGKGWTVKSNGTAL